MGKFELKQRLLNPNPDDVPVIIEFDTKEQLLTVEFVNQFAQQPNFKQFSLFRTALMVEFNDGTSETIGFIINKKELPQNLYEVQLPQWKAPLKPPPV